MTTLTIISTVGASLLTNYAKKVGANPNRFIDSIETMGEKQLEDLKRELINYILDLGENFGEASAELNSIFDILQKVDTQKHREIELMFAVSDTKQAKLIMEVLDEFITKHIKTHNGKPIKVYHDTIEGLNYKDIEHATKGLPTLAARIAEWIKNKKELGHDVILNITGGFKAESIYAAIVGLLARIPVYYMHEKFRESVQLPPIIENLEEKDIVILLEFIKKFYEGYKGEHS